MKVGKTEKFPVTAKENQFPDNDRKPEPGVIEGQMEKQKHASSLIEMFQQEALNEKQTRLLAQLKALEKDRLATDAWKIIAALEKEKGVLETQVQKLKAQNSNLTGGIDGAGNCKRTQTISSEIQNAVYKPTNILKDYSNESSVNEIRDELNKVLNAVTCGVKDKQVRAEDSKDGAPPLSTSNYVKKSAQDPVDTGMRCVPLTEEKLTERSPDKSKELREHVAGVCGLQNLGNTCFVNAGLQCLFSVTPFCRFFLVGGGHKTVSQRNPKNFPRGTPDKSQQSLSKVLGELVTKVWSGCYTDCDPTELYTAITTHFCHQLTPQRQHDCHEFLALFLDGLHHELNCVTSDSSNNSSPDQLTKNDCAEQRWREYTKSNDSLIVDTFQGQLQSEITCCSCSHKSSKYQPFTFLSVPLLSESYHTFVVTWVTCDLKGESDGKIRAVRCKVHVTKPSTVLKLKTNFVSLLPEDAQPELEDIRVSVVRNSQIVSIMSDEKQLTLFTDRRSKLYIFNPSKAPESLYFEGSSYSRWESMPFPKGQLPENCNQSRTTSLPFPSGRFSTQAYDSTMYYSPGAASASGEFVSALDQLHTESSTTGKSPMNKRHHYRLASPNTSTPKTQVSQTTTRVSLSNVYRLSATCCICLQEKADDQLISHDKCGRLYCRQCLQDAAGGVFQCQSYCPRCESEIVIQSHITNQKSRMIMVPIVLRRFEEDSKTKRLFGHPSLVVLPKNILGKDVYWFISKLLPDAVATLTFTLHLVDQQGVNCSRCTRITGCTGCEVNNGDMILNLQPCDNLAVQMGNISRWEAERMARCIEHDSIWKTRNTEDPVQLQDCLRTFVQSEQLPDTWYCQKCHQERNASKRLCLVRLPDTLIIHLKRYSQSGVKITAPVTFPLEDLDMREYIQLEHDSAEENGAEDFNYDLNACVCHEGSYSSGHYTAYTSNNGVWYRYDDSRVTKELPDNISFAKAYILFYHRRTVSPRSTSSSYSQESLKDKHVTGPVEKEITENDDILTSPKLPKTPLSSNEKKTVKEIGEELTEKLNILKPIAHKVFLRDSTDDVKETKNQIKRRRWMTNRKVSVGIKAEERETKPTARPEGACNEWEVNKCGCKQCDYFKQVERKIKKARQDANEKDSRTQDAPAWDNSKSVSKNSSLTSISVSVRSSISPSTTHSCTTESSVDHVYSKAEEIIPHYQKKQSSKTSAKLYSKDSSHIVDIERITHELKYAIENENIRRAVTLLKRGADPNLLVNGLSALHIAVGLDSPLNLRFTRLLLDYGGNPNVPSSEGITPIHVAIMWERINCLKILFNGEGNHYWAENKEKNALQQATAFETETGANTSDCFLKKLDERISKQLQQTTFQSDSPDSPPIFELGPTLSPNVGCSIARKRPEKKGSFKTVRRKVSRSFRRASGQFRRGIRQIRSLLRSSSGSDRRI